MKFSNVLFSKAAIIKSKLNLFQNKKGFSLIELVVAIGISMILLIAISCEIVRANREFNQTLSDTSQYFYVNEVFRFIEVELKDNVREVIVTDKSLMMVKYIKRPPAEASLVYSDIDFNSKVVNTIRLTSEEIKICYDTNPTQVSLLKNIENFEVKKYNNNLIVSIKMKKGKQFDRCFNLKNIES